MYAKISQHGFWGVILATLVLLWAVPAQGHKVTVFAWVESDTIYTESSFSAGKPVRNGKIEVYDPQGNRLIEGTTDEKGRFAFPVPRRSDLKIVLVAGMGHGNHWWVRANELSRQETNDQGPPGPTSTEPEYGPSVLHPQAGTDCLDAQTVQQIVNQALEKKLAPLEARMAQPAWQWRDIIAGIGYILGLMGVAVLARDRKQKA